MLVIQLLNSYQENECEVDSCTYITLSIALAYTHFSALWSNQYWEE